MSSNQLNTLPSSIARHLALLSMCLLGVFPARAELPTKPTLVNPPQTRSASLVADRIRFAFEPSNQFLIKVAVRNIQSRSPFISMLTDKGNCLIVINTQPESWAAWKAFRDQGNLGEAESYYFALLHELGHCVNKLNPTSSRQLFSEGYQSEFYADVFALVAAKRLLNKDSYQAIAEGVIRARIGQQRWYSPRTHATGRPLESVYQLLKSMDTETSLGSASLEQQSVDLIERSKATNTSLAFNPN
ncbi:MAG: hypothetical protein LW710_10165 [Burkholderiales bacterium]|jgi:hypothetical protein|uniref:hypothetical protein n=1 Tax=Limnobacter sp. TaxID=2003368 RepID=UPI0039BD8B94|nr:hypothetical protein [Burkholderiales bacterium]